MSKSVYTIGHSTQTVEHFIELLQMHGITAVADVRSSPYSRINPQFNREPLRERLRQSGIAYAFLGKQLGARSDDRRCYRDGKVQYDLLAQTSLFKDGIARVLEGSDTYRVGLMCAEKDPLECHRAILVSRVLHERAVDIKHVLADGRVETQEDLVERMLSRLHSHSEDMVSSKDELIQEAYRAQSEAIAYEDEAMRKTDQTVGVEGQS